MEGGIILPGNSMTLFKLAFTLSLIMTVMLESKRLGAMVTTRIPFLARSRVRGRVRDTIAPFEAAYATVILSKIQKHNLITLTLTGLSFKSCC